MGLFLSSSGLAGASQSEIEGALNLYATERGGLFQKAEMAFECPSALAIVEGRDRHFTVLYPWNFFDWDDASSFLSRTFGSPVFSVHIHDEDLWMYVLFVDGEEVDQFNPIADYWSDELTDEEYALWAGDAALVARVWPGLKAEEIRNYLVRWDLDAGESGRAYPDDRHGFNDCFQLIDFMGRLGLAYPLDEQGKVRGVTYRFEIPGSD
jgi:hypothetical protein